MKILVVTLLPILIIAPFMPSKAQITATIKGLDNDTVYVCFINAYPVVPRYFDQQVTPLFFEFVFI